MWSKCLFSVYDAINTCNDTRSCNDAPQEDSDDEGNETPHAKLIKTTNEFLAIIDQQKAFMKRNKVPVELVEQLETLIVGNQISLCSKEKEVTDYFKSFSQSPNPKDVYKTVADVLRDITIVDSLTDSTLEMDSIKFESINTRIALGTMNALLRNEVPQGGLQHQSVVSLQGPQNIQTLNQLTHLKKS